LVAEYAATAPQNPTISYLTSDTLGTPRINTDANGQVTARHDYMPFGEEIIGLGNRQSTNGYQTDNIRQKFTQKERDTETGLDYFGARYYGSNLGRFTSVDPVNLTPERLLDPQRINLYVYTRDNPLKYTDPTGKDVKLDSKLKPADADRMIKLIVEAYRREGGRAAIKKMADSKLTTTFTIGNLPGEKYGKTS